jgi:hypothetical protein
MNMDVGLAISRFNCVPGVSMRDPLRMRSFGVGEIYNRAEEIHGPAKAEGLAPGNATAGITKVGHSQCIFWNPYRRRYENKWIRDPEEFMYSGEGSSGDMTETGGNADLILSETTQREVLVFYKMERAGSQWKHLGRYNVVDHEWGTSQDSKNELRRDIRFRVRAVDEEVDRGQVPVVKLADAPRTPTEEEIWNVLLKSPYQADIERRRRTRVHRNKREADPLKTEYVRIRAQTFGGACELCDQTPSWLTDDGQPHYQAHHIDADIDSVDWIAALCGTCHDRLHHSADRKEIALHLRTIIAKRQTNLNRPLYEPSAIKVSYHEST